MKTIGEGIRHLREDILNLSRQEFVKNLGITTKSLERYENNERTPDADFFTRVWQKYHKNISIADLDRILYGEKYAAEETGDYKVVPLLSPEEDIYLEKLLTVLRNPNTKKAIMENIDTFLKVPMPIDTRPFPGGKKGGMNRS